MLLEGKTVIITSNSSIFLKLTSLLIQKSGYSRSQFLIIAENGLTNWQILKERTLKVGLITALDEWCYTKYESLLNLWARAEKKYFSSLEIHIISPDYIVKSVKKNIISDNIQLFNAQNLISIGSGYIPRQILSLFQNKYNIHPGILPVYKGIGTPEAIMKGDFQNCGWTFHELSPQIDSGDILKICYINFRELVSLNIPDQYTYIYIHFINNIFINNLSEEKIKNSQNLKFNSCVRMSSYALGIFKNKLF
jgi:hypothetical protein